MEGKGTTDPSKENIFVRILRKIGETYTWLKDKLISLFKLLCESITEALLGIKSFLTSCCEKLREVLSWINTQLDSRHFGKKMAVSEEDKKEQASLPLLSEMKIMGVVPEKKASLSIPLLVETKMVVQKMRSSANQCLGNGNSPEMKAACLTLNRFLDLFEEFIKLLESAYENPFRLIFRILDALLIYRSKKGDEAMAIHTLILASTLPPF